MTIRTPDANATVVERPKRNRTPTPAPDPTIESAELAAQYACGALLQLADAMDVWSQAAGLNLRGADLQIMCEGRGDGTMWVTIH